MAPLSWLCVVVGASMLSPLPFREAERGGQSHCFAIAIIITSTRCRVHHSNELFIATFFANFLELRKAEVQLRRMPKRRSSQNSYSTTFVNNCKRKGPCTRLLRAGSTLQAGRV